MIRIAVFASGSGSNAEKLISHFSASSVGRISLIITNNPSAGVIERANRLAVKCCVYSKAEFSNPSGVEQLLKEEKIDFIILAGFLLLVPGNLIRAFSGKIINIHPALLPKFGGKGFYGDRVHQSVIEHKEIISGITIHHVNDKFDEGNIIFQAACHVEKTDSPESLAKKIHELEYTYFPVVSEKVIRTTFNIPA